MAEPKKVSSWLAAAKAVPSAALSPSTSPDQGSMLKSVYGATENPHKPSTSFVAVLRPSQRRKSTSPQKGNEPGLPQGDDFPALESPPKKSSPIGGAVKAGKEGGGSGRSTGAWGADAVKLIRPSTRNGEEKSPVVRTTETGQSGGQRTAGPAPPLAIKQTQNSEKVALTAVTEKSAAVTRSPPPPEVTAEFEGLMSELLTGLQSQGPVHLPTPSPQVAGLVSAKVVLPSQAKGATATPTGPVLNPPVESTNQAVPLSRVLFPVSQTQTAGAKPPTPRTLRTKPVTPVRWTIPTTTQGAVHTGAQTPPPKELSFFAVPPKIPTAYSPKSVLDLSSPEGSPTLRQHLSPNQTPPARPSAYRPAMHADPKKVIGRKMDAVADFSDALTSSPFSYSLWGSPDHPLTSAESNVLRESPCNVVKEASPAKVSRLGAWLGKETGGLLETETEFHQALFRGKVAQPAPFAQAAEAETGPEDDESCCKICFERESNSAYLCGHMLCFDCAEHIHVHKKVCPFCAKPIETVLRVFT